MRTCVLLILPLVAACAEWPRVANVPDGGDIDKAGVEPGDLVQISWSTSPEPSESNDLPTDPGATPLPLEHGQGRVFEGSLDGIGWADALTPEPISDANCPGTQGSRSPLGAGDYIADVDFYTLEVGFDGTLCAALEIDADSVGWDLAPHSVDPCGIPLGLIADSNGETVGVDLGGTFDGWAANVQAGDRVAIGLAGYAPNDAAAQLSYSLAVSVVATRKDGSEGVCPTHPARSGE